MPVSGNKIARGGTRASAPDRRAADLVADRVRMPVGGNKITRGDIRT